MNWTAQAQAYRGSEVLSAPPGRLLIITFDALLTSMTRLRLALSTNNHELGATSLSTARALLGELLATLNRKEGGEIASGLASLYVFILGELNEISVSRDAVRLERNTALIRELRDAFAEIALTPARAAS
jgi:flagellar protein FliS